MEGQHITYRLLQFFEIFIPKEIFSQASVQFSDAMEGQHITYRLPQFFEIFIPKEIFSQASVHSFAVLVVNKCVHYRLIFFLAIIKLN